MKRIKDIFSKLINVTILILILFYIFLGVANVVGSSMMPGIEDKDVLIFCPLVSPKRGDVIVLKEDKKYVIKRVIALSEDSLLIKNNQVFINSEMLYEEYLLEQEWKGFYSGIVDKDYYYVMGDNRNNSRDSRTFGLVHKSDIVGVCIFNLTDTLGLYLYQVKYAVIGILVLELIISLSLNFKEEENGKDNCSRG